MPFVILIIGLLLIWGLIGWPALIVVGAAILATHFGYEWWMDRKWIKRRSMFGWLRWPWWR